VLLLLLQLLLELFLFGCQRLQPLLQLTQLGHPLLRGHGRSQVPGRSSPGVLGKVLPASQTLGDSPSAASRPVLLSALALFCFCVT